MDWRWFHQPLPDRLWIQGLQAPSSNQGMSGKGGAKVFIIRDQRLSRWWKLGITERSYQQDIRGIVQNQRIAWQCFGWFAGTANPC